MASVTITGGVTFAEGTSVSVYPRTAWPSFQPPSGAPSGSAAAGPVTITNNAATFSGLADATQYVAYAASPNRYKSFSTPPASVSSTPADLSILARQLSDLARTGGWLPTGAIDQTIQDRVTNGTSTPGTGVLLLAGGIVIPGGRAVSSITFMSAAAATTPTNQWFCLVDKATLNVLATTVDDTTTAWGANVAKTLLLATAIGGATPGGTYTPANAQEVYVGCTQAAATPATLRAATGFNNVNALAPVIVGTSNGSLTTPGSLPATVNALTATSSLAYAYIS